MSDITVSCSWERTPTFVHILPEEKGLTEAEGLMNKSVSKTSAEKTGAEASGDAAPWLRIGAGSPVLALCIASNARVIEVHDVNNADAAVVTCEASSESEGWYMHYLCGNVGQPLLVPQGRAVQLKLFGRRPFNEIKVACVCVVAGKPQAPPQAVHLTVEERLLQLEHQMQENMEMVLRRLSSAESRLEAIETRMRSGGAA